MDSILAMSSEVRGEFAKFAKYASNIFLKANSSLSFQLISLIFSKMLDIYPSFSLKTSHFEKNQISKRYDRTKFLPFFRFLDTKTIVKLIKNLELSPKHI